MINNRYKIINKIGEGRNRVFLCSDSFLADKKFAIKIIEGDKGSEELQAFYDEYNLLRKLEHPNIIDAYDYGTILSITSEEILQAIRTGDKYIILEYFESTELSSFRELNEYNLLEIIKQISSVLYYLHQSQYLYLDLKPENILIKNVNDKLTLKFIDFGFAVYMPLIDSFPGRGTKEYLAPEIIKKEHIDHRTDLYSLGILLYKLIFKKFPFDVTKEIEIYKAHLNNRFEVPKTDFTLPFDEVIIKLTEKDPSERYYTVLQLLQHLNIDIKDIKNNWGFIPNFCCMFHLQSEVKNYLSKPSEGKVLLLQGSSNCGKSELLNNIRKNFDNVIDLSKIKFANTSQFARVLLNFLIHNECVYNKIDASLIQYIGFHVNESSKDVLSQLKSIVAKVSQVAEFTILIDDIDELSPLSLELLKNIFPILQSNDIKIIISENSDSNIAQKYFNNLFSMEIPPFNDTELTQFIDESYSVFFPKENLLPLIKEYSDYFPGNIKNFVKDLIFLEIIDFTPDGPVIVDDFGKTSIQNSFEGLFKKRTAQLRYEELKYLKILSSLNNSLPEFVMAKLMDLEEADSLLLVGELRNKGLLQKSVVQLNPTLFSKSLKNYLYGLINDKSEFHHELALTLKNLQYDGVDSEVAYQFECAGNYLDAYHYYKRLVAKSELVSAYSTIKQILERIREFDLPEGLKKEIDIDLSSSFYKLSEFNSCLELTDHLLEGELDEQVRYTLVLQKAGCLFNLGELSRSREILLKLLENSSDEKENNRISLELARIELDSNNFDLVDGYCTKIIGNENSTPLEMGKAYNLLGLAEFYGNNDLDATLKNLLNTLGYYEKTNDVIEIAGIELNIGNICNIMRDSEAAKKHWNKALQLNQSVGNVEQEANLLLSTGIYNFNKHDFDTAIEQYKRAENIFYGIDYNKGIGLVATNLAEVYVEICEYQNALNSVLKSKEIFENLANYAEILEADFILGRLMFRLNNRSYIENLHKEQNRIGNKNENPRFDFIIGVFELYISVLNDSEINRELLENLIISAENFDDFITYYDLCGIKIDLLINNSEYSTAIDFLKELTAKIPEKDLKDIEAWRHYYNGKIAAVYEGKELEPEIVYLNKAFELIEEESISELTQKILYRLTDYYLKRGNIKKATQFKYYLDSVREFIYERILDKSLKKSYKSSKLNQNIDFLLNNIPSI